MEIKLRRGFTYECLVRRGIYYEYHELIDLGERGLFPRQPVPFMWDAEEIWDWLELYSYRLPPKPQEH
jgi:hypothetical protein